MDLRSKRRGENIYSVYSCYNYRLYGNISCKNKSNINYNYIKSAVYHLIKNIFEIFISDEFFNNLEFELPENDLNIKVVECFVNRINIFGRDKIEIILDFSDISTEL